MRSVVSARSRNRRAQAADELEVALARVRPAHRASGSAVDPDWSGRCACSQTAAHSAIASITSGRKSFGCGLVKRIRSIPSTASTARSSSANPVRGSGGRSRPYELTFWPSSVTSRTPVGGERGRPRRGSRPAGGSPRGRARPGRCSTRTRSCSPSRSAPTPGTAARGASGASPEKRRSSPVPKRAAGDAEAAGAEPVAEVGDRAGAEGDVDERVALEEPLALRLGVAAADGDHRAPGCAL